MTEVFFFSDLSFFGYPCQSKVVSTCLWNAQTIKEIPFIVGKQGIAERALGVCCTSIGFSGIVLRSDAIPVLAKNNASRRIVG